jgi:glycosyltransferase involved in cell wall biosynthesis
MWRIIKIVLKSIVSCIDHVLFVIVLLLGVFLLLAALPWIQRSRKIWQNTAKGSRKALILLPFKLEKVMNRGYEHLFPLRNQSVEWIGLLDSTNSRNAEIKITDDLYLLAWQKPKLIQIIKKCGFKGTAVIIRECITITKITRFCIKEQIGVLRAYQHHYPALRAGLVSWFITIPFMVDIAGNYELLRRLNGKDYYFKRLCRLPFFRIVGRMLGDWLLGWPLGRAARVLGRNKNNYEHAFALGAPLERLSLLRINSFGEAFNSYDPDEPPSKPAEYPYFLFVGRLSREKLPLDAIDAFEIAAPQLPEYRFVIIGDGKLREEVEHKIERCKYKDRIVLLGACRNDIVLSWTAHAKGVICPYSGSTLVEAMLCCIPVAAYDVEWHAEVIIDDYTGFLVPFRSITAMAKKLIYMADNYEETRKVGQRGRELARVVFDQEKICEKESMFYMQAIAYGGENE